MKRKELKRWRKKLGKAWNAVVESRDVADVAISELEGVIEAIQTKLQRKGKA
jgi:hypothetical protein